jgi:chloramphenicol 3-O phosphotransferase
VQDAAALPYLGMGLDRFITMLPPRYLRRPLWNDILGRATEPGAAGQVLFAGMHSAIAAAAASGNNFIADHVVVQRPWVEECARLFASLPAYLIGVHCPPDMLEQRELRRQNKTLGQARAQFNLVHQHTAYDLELDTSRLTLAECAYQIIARLETPPRAFMRLNPR